MPKPQFEAWELEHAEAELRHVGVRNAYGVTPSDAYAFIRYVAMALRFALIVRPDFRELRVAAAMYEVWRATASVEWDVPAQPAPAPPVVVDPVGAVVWDAADPAGSLESLLHIGFADPTDEQLVRVVERLRVMQEFPPGRDPHVLCADPDHDGECPRREVVREVRRQHASETAA